MAARRLLFAVGSGGSFTPPEVDEMAVVAFLTRLSNIVVTEDTVFPFTTARLMNTAYCTWAGTGEPIVIVQSGWYQIRANVSTLGTSYSGPSNADYFVLIGRNGITLNDTIAGEHAGRGSGVSADLTHAGTIEYLTAGDTIAMYVQNAVSGQTTLLVESNPSDGLPSGYPTDDGPGTISPHLILVSMGGQAPS